MPVNKSRRMFMKDMAKAAGRVPSLSPLSFGPTVIEASDTGTGPLQNAANRTLVVVQLLGGNDGINTVVPYGQQAYYDNRPTLALSSQDIIQLDGDIGLHPSLTGLAGLYSDHNAAIIQGVGYPNPNLSHNESTMIWETASPDSSLLNGWLGRYLDAAVPTDNTIKAVNVDSLLPLTLRGAVQNGLSVYALSQFTVQNLISQKNRTPDQDTVKAINEVQCIACQEYNTMVNSMMQSGLDAISASDILSQAAASYQTSVTYPTDDFGTRMKLAAQITTSSMKPRIVYVQIGGFDTHAAQAGTQATLLQSLSNGITAFYNDMSSKGLANNTAIVTFTEFGRRLKENGNKGTDHGAAQPVFMVGGQISGNLYSSYPSLTNLDSSGNIQYNVDFRQVYASILDKWLDIDPSTVLGSEYDELSVFQ